MNSPCRLTPVAPEPKIEDEIYQLTKKVVDQADAILSEVRQRASQLNRQNRESAHRFVVQILDAMKQHRQLGIQKVTQMIDEGTKGLQFQMQALEATTRNSASLLVGMAEEGLERIVGTVSVSGDANLTQTLEEAIVEAEKCIRVLWSDLDQMFSHHVLYSLEVIGEQVENMTTQMIKYLRPEREFRNASIRYQHVKMCYNISQANMETAATIEQLLELQDHLYKTTNTIHSLQAIAGQQSDSELQKYEKMCQELLNDLLHGHNYFLGLEIRNQSDHLYPQMKRFIIGAWIAAVQKASSIFQEMVSGRAILKDEHRKRFLDDVEHSLQQLGKQLKTKAGIMVNATAASKFTQLAQFEDLSTLMRDRFQNATNVINQLYTEGLAKVSEDLDFDVEFFIDQRIPFLSTLTDQNFLPTDTCPLAMEFRDYVSRLVNDVVNRNGLDELDQMLPSDGGAVTKGLSQITGLHPRFLRNLDFQKVIYL